MSFASFSIPLPPSLNNIFFNRPHGGRAKTTEYKNWRDEAAWQIRSQRPSHIAGEVKVEIIIERPNASSDLDNRIKSVLDAVVKAGVIEDDKRVVDLRAKWGDVQGARVSIYSVDRVAA